MFIQVMRGRCADATALKKQLDLWEATLADGADGWLGTTGGVTADGTFVGVVRFDSRASSRSSRSFSASASSVVALRSTW